MNACYSMIEWCLLECPHAVEQGIALISPTMLMTTHKRG
jgi:hypothetical protein